MAQDVLEDVAPDLYHCITCGTTAFPEDLCSCCSRCIDCVAELGHRRTRYVGDEVEGYNAPK